MKMISCLIAMLIAAIMCVGQTKPRRDANKCNVPALAPVAFISLPGRPFQALPTADGCWIFVSITAYSDSAETGIAVLRRSAGTVSLERVIPRTPKPARTGAPAVIGMALTHDGKLLAAAADDRILFYDVERLKNGDASPLLGSLLLEGTTPGFFHVAITHDDRFLFASNHAEQSLTVVNLTSARRSGFAPSAVVGRVPVGWGPVSLVFSPDEKLLYTSSQIARDDWHWPNLCRPLNARAPDAPPNHAQGAVVVLDVRRAERDPQHAIIATMPAGCDPVRLALSPAGDRAFVTARSDKSLLAFDTRRMLSDSAHAQVSSWTTRTGPVGVAVFDGGHRVAVTTANRFANSSTDSETLTVYDVRSGGDLRGQVLGTIRVANGPLELRLTDDKQTLLVTNFEGQSLELIDLARMPLENH